MFTLLRHFSIVCFVALSIAALVLMAGCYHGSKLFLEASLGEQGAAFARGLYGELRSDTPGGGALAPVVQPHLRRGALLAFRVVGGDQRVTLSTEPGEVGRDVSADPGQQAARESGLPVAELTSATVLTPFGEPRAASAVLSIHTPAIVNCAESGPVIGIVLDVSKIVEGWHDALIHFAVLVTTVFVVLYVVLLVAVSHAAAEVIARNAALKAERGQARSDVDRLRQDLARQAADLDRLRRQSAPLFGPRE